MEGTGRHFRFTLIALTAVTMACARSHQMPVCRFEPHPRPLLETIGLSSSWDPELAVDTAGTLYVFAVYDQDSKSRLGLVMSENGGDTLAPAVVPISGAGLSIVSHGEQSPKVAMTRSEIYTLWQEIAEDGTGRIMSARSLSWGQSFDKPVQVSDKDARGYRGFASIGVGPNGDVYAVWLDERDNSGRDQETSSVYLAKSVDRGATFGRNVRVANHTCPCCRPSLAFGPKGEVYVAWRRVFSGEIRDVVVSTSRDGGQTFAEPVRVHDDGWKLNGCPDSGPTLTESDDNLYVAWMTAGDNAQPRVQLARSVDGAQSFAEPRDISGDILDPNHPVLKTGSDGTMWLVFQGRAPSANGSWHKTQAYVVQIGPSGNPSLPMSVPGSENSISYPTLALGSGGRMFLAWTQPAGNRQAIMLSRGRTKS
jgi:hypothetical protein